MMEVKIPTADAESPFSPSGYSLWPQTPKAVITSDHSPTTGTIRLKLDVPPPVPEKDYPRKPQPLPPPPPPPASPPSRRESLRPLTRSTNRLSFGSLSSAQKRNIKFGKGKHASVELIPQPSDDPEDPLNWPRWRKHLNFVSLLVMVGLIGGMKTAFVTTNGVMTADYRVSYTSIAALTAIPLMLSSFTGTLCLIASKMVGKRPLYLISLLLVFIGSIWNMTADDSYQSCMAARVFQGLGWGAFDTLILGSIQDTYFVSQNQDSSPLSLHGSHHFV